MLSEYLGEIERKEKKMKKVLLLGLGFWGRNWLELILRTDKSGQAGVAGGSGGNWKKRRKNMI